MLLSCTCASLVGSLALAQTNSVPFLNQPLVPTTTAPGGPSFTLTINGTQFVSGSVVNWNGIALTTTFVNSSQLTATVPASDIATPGTAGVTVTNPAPGGGTSNVTYFSISSPASTLVFAALNSLGSYSPLVAADFNGDGKLDLASVALVGVSTRICVQLGVGDGSFQAPTCSAENFGTLNSTIASDFNGDGKLDLAGVDGNGLHVWLGNGDGTFQTGMDFTAGPNGSQSWALAAGDFNGDGKRDLAVANAPNVAGSSGSVSVLLGNGDGTFRSPVDYALGTLGLFSVAVGDFNRDGKLDLVSNSLILLGNGDGTFGSPQPLPTPGERVITADVNGDGKLDLIEISGLGVLLGNGDGTFQPAVGYADPNPLVFPPNPFAVAAADFNADGYVDLVVVNNTNPGFVSIFLGNGDGTFQTPVDFATGPNPNTLAVADFNGDGKTDLAVMAQGGTLDLNVLLQGTLPALQTLPPGLAFSQQAIGTTSPAQTVTLTNTGTATLNISSIAVKGANATDFAQTSTCNSSLAVNTSCQVSVAFTPIANGNRTALVSVTDNAPGSPQAVPLAGTTPAYLSPTSVTFPSQYVGTSGLPQTVTLNNTGNIPIVISSVTVTPSDFAPLSACGSTLAAGVSCAIGIFFDPTASGTRNGVLTVTDSASDSPHTVSLSGTGQDFSVAASGASSASVSRGQTANYTIAMASAGGFSQAVALSCSGAPAQSICSLSNTSVTLNGSTSTSVNVTVTTAGGSAGPAYPGDLFLKPARRLALWLPLCAFPSLAISGTFGMRRRRRQSRTLLCLFSFSLLFVALSLSGCGGSTSRVGTGGNGTPAGTYTLNVTGSFTSGATNLTHTAKLTLVVQ